MAKEYEPTFEASDIISLQRFHIYIKLMINGMTSLPFSARILLPWEDDAVLPKRTGSKEKVVAMSRERYGTDALRVEEIIKRWIERPFDKGMAIAEEHRGKKQSEVIVSTTSELQAKE